MELVGDSACDALAADLVRRASLALDAGVSPTLVDDGLGGTYFIRDEHGDELSVFKPRDEEPNAINNPKNEGRSGLGEAGLKGGIRIGDAAFNEAAAYLLDARSGHFSRVPPTAIARSEHSAFFDVSSGEGNSYDEAVHSPFRSLKTKVGSLQRFVSNDGCADDFSASIFSDLEVQRIACLDVRLFNTDRHSANLLVQRTPRPETLTPRGVSPSPPDSSPPDSSPPRSPARSASPSSPLVRSPEARPTSPSPLGASQPTSIVPPVSCSLQYDAEAHSEVMRVDVALPPMLPVPILGRAVALNRGARPVSTLPPPLSLPATLQPRTEVEDGAAGEYPRLIPIDHGFCLPATITVPYFEWQHWPQADAPLHPKMSPVSVLSSCGVTSGAAAGVVSSWAILEPESDEPPTRLQLLCHAARVEALQKCYETTKALQPAARHAAEEAAFLEILRRRLTEHFNSVAPAAAPPRKA
eukprot:jgi/Chrpa1/27676/Chrysochromulina_OHIO_Genome00016139-RA